MHPTKILAFLLLASVLALRPATAAGPSKSIDAGFLITSESAGRVSLRKSLTEIKRAGSDLTFRPAGRNEIKVFRRDQHAMTLFISRITVNSGELDPDADDRILPSGLEVFDPAYAVPPGIHAGMKLSELATLAPRGLRIARSDNGEEMVYVDEVPTDVLLIATSPTGTAGDYNARAPSDPPFRTSKYHPEATLRSIRIGTRGKLKERRDQRGR